MPQPDSPTAETRPAPRAGGPTGDGEVVLGRYRLVRRLGAGGFGTVWEARDERLGRTVAVKRVPVDHGPSAARAEREALAAARLGHPAIVALYDTGHDEGATYLVSELVRGETLGALERAGRLSDRDVARIGAGLCDALAHAHARGVVHRDVKPGNVMVADDGQPKLCDFGIARLADLTSLTLTGDVVGTIAYMAPEQAEGRPVGPPADLHSLALVLYEALTGWNPIRAEGAAATARRVGRGVPALGRVRPDLPAGVGAALDRALAVDPAARGTVEELRDALAAAVPALSDEAGIVEAALPPRRLRPLGRLTGAERERVDPEPDDPADAGRLAGAERERGDPVPWGDEAGRPAGAERERGDPGPGEGEAPGWRARVAGRVAAGAGAGVLAAVALAELPVDLPRDASAGAVALAVAVAVALLPRLAWLAAAAALVALLTGERLAAAVALAAVPLALPRAGRWWSLPGAAPALGALGAATAFPALAGQAARAHHRALLGALGAGWVAAAALVTGAADPDGALTAATAGVWALAAAVLPFAVRGRTIVVALLGAAAWAAALAVATTAVADALTAEPPAGAVLGAIAGAAAAVLVRSVRD